MKELYARFKKLTGANGMDLAAQEGRSKQYISVLLHHHNRKSQKKLTDAMQRYIESIIKKERAEQLRRLRELYRLHEQIEDYANDRQA